MFVLRVKGKTKHTFVLCEKGKTKKHVCAVCERKNKNTFVL